MRKQAYNSKDQKIPYAILTTDYVVNEPDITTSIQIINQDCMSYMKTLPDNSINTIITSPPYNKIGLRKNKGLITGGNGGRWKGVDGNILYNSYDDDMAEEEYQKWQINILNECCRILKPDGSMFYNHKIRRYNKQAFFPTWVFETKFKFYQQIIWNRKNFVDGNIKYLNPQTELIFWLTKDNPKVFKSNAIFKGEIWDIPPKPNKLHPAPFPQELSDNCVLLTTEEGDVVFDPFNGCGTTGKSCKKFNRNYIGTDIDKQYCETSKILIEEK